MPTVVTDGPGFGLGLLCELLGTSHGLPTVDTEGPGFGLGLPCELLLGVSHGFLLLTPDGDDGDDCPPEGGGRAVVGASGLCLPAAMTGLRVGRLVGFGSEPSEGGRAVLDADFSGSPMSV